MSYATIEDRVDRLDALFGKFIAEMRQSKRDLDKKWGDLANKMGTIIEDMRMGADTMELANAAVLEEGIVKTG
jgi:hypothetical protein